MLALSAVWIALLTLLLATAMVIHRPTMTDITVMLVLYFGSPGSMCLAGLVLWAFRKDPADDPNIRAQCLQAKTAIALALFAAAIVYALIYFSQKIIPVEAGPTSS